MLLRCFVHVINLACKATIAGLEEMADGLISHLRHLICAVPIQSVCSIICSSSLWCEHFANTVKTLINKELQIILDTDTCWSSTHLMMEQALILCLAINTFLSSDDFQDLARNNNISTHDWDLLDDMSIVLNVPHQFQETLSAEKTPTLCDMLPAFEAVSTLWKAQRQEFPGLSCAIDAGLEKLSEYTELAHDVPAHMLAMGICHSVFK
ncbi:hypothetical protein EDD18DRAFT_1067752 [Armillaria luteobubalina]|uniref:HAT C-terminal dimerisation domain-containing protein n=1 Tax=Armillaria luteobubalina TaxID=153913 RepID=A0AA39US68_9AGAR|nr:hypothetical protein EDD18DRAFT_1067752 [Armillaria luteobubalina]